ncbi:MAG: hypothetical protein ACPLYD_16345, partial [Anaerolineae bacterium]
RWGSPRGAAKQSPGTGMAREGERIVGLVYVVDARVLFWYLVGSPQISEGDGASLRERLPARRR